MLKTTRILGSLALLAAGILLVVSGCGSDSTAPKDELPPISQQAAAEQAGYFASAVAQAYDIYQDALHGKEVIVHDFTTGDASGTFTMDFRSGGPGGTASASGSADYIHIYTDTDQDVRITQAGLTIPLVIATFDVEVYPYDATPPESGTVNGAGTLVSGAYTSTFTIGGVFLNVSSYPPSGTLTYSAGGHDVTVEFDGSRFATLTVGAEMWLVNLDTGELVAPTK
jgi:hypothetical protein